MVASECGFQPRVPNTVGRLNPAAEMPPLPASWKHCLHVKNRHNPRVESVKIVALVAAGLILAKWLVELWLSLLNQRHVRAHADTVPEAFKDVVDAPTYAKSVDYTLAGSRFGQWQDIWSTTVLLLVLFSGVARSILSLARSYSLRAFLTGAV